MLRLFTPRCPVDAREQAWTERRLRWLADRLGSAAIQNQPVIRPLQELFPVDYAGRPEQVPGVLERISELMGGPARPFELRFSDACGGGQCCTPGSESAAAMELTADDLADPHRLAGRLSVGVAGVVLRDRGHVAVDAPDAAAVACLMAVAFGFGATLRSVSGGAADAQLIQGHWWLGRTGILTPRIVGYAAALLTWVRDEPLSGVVRALSPDAAQACRAGYRFVTKTGDSRFHPAGVSQPLLSRTVTSILDDLRHGSQAARISAMWELAESDRRPETAVGPLTDCLSDRSPEVRTEAALTLAEFGSLARSALPRLLSLSEAREAENRLAAVRAIGRIRPELHEMVDGLVVSEVLANRVTDTNRNVIQETLQVLGGYNDEVAPLLTRAVPHLVGLARDCRFEDLQSVLAPMVQALRHPQAFLETEMEELHVDAELRDRVLQELQLVLTGDSSDDVSISA